MALAAARRAAAAANTHRRGRRGAPRWPPASAARARSSRAAANPPGAAESAPPHIPVLLDAVLEAFAPLRLATYLDGTLGAGGHAAAVAAAHPELEAVVGLDVDAGARALAAARLSPLASASGFRLDIVDANFRDMGRVLAELGAAGGPPAPAAPPSAILLDLGFSSMQVDAPERGLSFARDGPLDMRLAAGGPGGGAGGLTANDIVNTWTESALAALFRAAGEERHAGLAARRIVAARAGGRLESTRALVAAVGALGPPSRGKAKVLHPATRVFQALRIAVNDELGALEQGLPAALEALAPGGRLAVISFHSLEDRAVKRAFLTAAGRPPPDEGGDRVQRWLAAARDAEEAPPPVLGRIVTRRPVAPTATEAASNPRARSAKLRVFEKARA